MRIAFFADNFYPELSGISDSILITGKELTKRGHSIIYIGPEYASKDYALVGETLYKENDQELVKGMPVLRLPSVTLPYSPTGQSRIAIPSGSALSYLQIWKPDIVHTNSPYGTGFEAKKVAKTLGIPLIGTNHTPIEEFYPLIPQLMRRFDAWYYNHCVFVSTPFTKLLSNMQKAGFTREGKAIANPVVNDSFTIPATEEKNHIRHELKLTGPVILYAGRIAPEKHIDLLLRSMAKLVQKYPSSTLVITGHGSAVIGLLALAQELHILERVVFTGFISQESLVQYYKAADIFAIMSTADSQSIALMQAYASGIPAVGARAHGLPDYIPSECGYLVEPGDSQDLTHKIELLLTDEQQRITMGKAGAQFIQQFSPEKIADEWEKIYSKFTK